MKVNINDESIKSGHRAALVFKDQIDCASKDPERALGTIDETGELRFTDDKFEAKITTLAKHGRVGFSRHKGVNGYVFVTSELPEFYTVSDALTESTISTSSNANEVFKALFESVEHSIVPNKIELETNRSYKLWDKVNSPEIEILPIYASKGDILESDKKKVIGAVDAIKSTFTLTDELAVKRIIEAAAVPLLSEIGLSKMIQRDGFYLDFLAPDLRITSIEEVESDDEEVEETAHFLNDDEDEEEVEVKVKRELDESINEATTTEDNMNTNPQLLQGQTRKDGYMSPGEPEQIYKQKKVEAPAKDDADQEARMQQYLHFATSFNF